MNIKEAFQLLNNPRTYARATHWPTGRCVHYDPTTGLVMVYLDGQTTPYTAPAGDVLGEWEVSRRLAPVARRPASKHVPALAWLQAIEDMVNSEEAPPVVLLREGGPVARHVVEAASPIGTPVLVRDVPPAFPDMAGYAEACIIDAALWDDMPPTQQLLAREAWARIIVIGDVAAKGDL